MTKSYLPKGTSKMSREQSSRPATAVGLGLSMSLAERADHERQPLAGVWLRDRAVCAPLGDLRHQSVFPLCVHRCHHRGIHRLQSRLGLHDHAVSGDFRNTLDVRLLDRAGHMVALVNTVLGKLERRLMYRTTLIGNPLGSSCRHSLIASSRGT